MPSGSSSSITSENQKVALLAALVESSNDAIVATTIEGTVTSWNRAAEELLQYGAPEMVGTSILQVIPADRHAEEHAILRKVAGGEKVQSVESVWQRRDGHLFPVALTASPILDANGEIIGVSAILRDLTKHRQREQAQRENEAAVSEERLQTVFAHMTEGLVLSDMDGMLLHWNEAALKMHGFVDSTEWQRGLRDFVQIFELQTTEGRVLPYEEWPMPRIFRGDSLHGLDVRIRRRDSEWSRVFSYSGSRVREPNGKEVAFLTITDQTWRAEAEQRYRETAEGLRQSEELTRSVLNSVLAKIAVLDRDGTITMLNDRWLRFAIEKGHPASTPWVGRSYFANCEHLIPSSKEGLSAAAGIREVLAGARAEFSLEYPCRAATGTRWFLMSVTSLAGGEGAVVAHLNITEHKVAQETIEQQAALLDEAREGIMVRDLGGKVLFWSKGAEKMYGWTREEALGQDLASLLYRGEDDYSEAIAAVIASGEWNGELEQLTKSGRVICIDARWSLLRGEEGRPKAVLAINTDVTAKKQLEAQYLRAQRMESIGTLAGGVAHDLNNMLAPILMSVELLRSKVTAPSDQALLSMLEEGATRGAEMVRQILTFARGVDSRQILVNPKHFILDVSRILGDTLLKQIEIETFVPQGIWGVTGDPTQLHQVLLNLCVNARDAMSQGGKLTVSAKNEILDEHYAAMHIEAKPGPYVVISVQDTGTGIPPQILDKIFDPFFTTKEVGKGTGLGLATTAAIVKSHGGFINVYSELGRGTTFRVYLPASGEGPADTIAETTNLLPRGNGEVILVVDDESSIREITRQTLEAFGYRVLTAADGADAIATYARRSDIAVVLTDMMMPILDGTATIHALKRMNPQVRVIAATGLATANQRDAAMAAGARHFLQKPYSADAVLTLLREVLTYSETARA